MKNQNFVRWLSFAVGGLVLTGFGLSLLGEAIIAKYKKRSWFWPGTLSLVVFNAGVSLIGNAVRYRVRLDQEKALEK
ncbi:MAG: hypothetical protein ACLFUB_11695 [Cyclobacteriaceae bacterium]